MEPSAALRRIAFLLERDLADSYRVQAFRTAAAAVAAAGDAQIRQRAATGTLTALPGIGPRTAEVITAALNGEVPAYLTALEGQPWEGDGLAADARGLLEATTGDCHMHSDWSDGGSPIEEMARTCVELGHQWAALTDHSPRLTVARGLSRERLEQQLDVVARLNSELAPFRLLTGIEVDILEDGTLDQDDDLLARLDVVVASVHWHLRDASWPPSDRCATRRRRSATPTSTAGSPAPDAGTSSTTSPPPSTRCSTGYRMRSHPSGSSSTTPGTSCARR